VKEAGQPTALVDAKALRHEIVVLDFLAHQTYQLSVSCPELIAADVGGQRFG